MEGIRRYRGGHESSNSFASSSICFHYDGHYPRLPQPPTAKPPPDSAHRPPPTLASNPRRVQPLEHFYVRVFGRVSAVSFAKLHFQKTILSTCRVVVNLLRTARWFHIIFIVYTDRVLNNCRLLIVLFDQLLCSYVLS